MSSVKTNRKFRVGFPVEEVPREGVGESDLTGGERTGGVLGNVYEADRVSKEKQKVQKSTNIY